MANFPLTQVEGGGSDVAPIITQGKFLPDYPSTVGENYLYDPLGKQFVPEKFAGSDLAVAAYLGPTGTYTGTRFGSSCVTTDDGEQWVFNCTHAAASGNTTAYFQIYKKEGQSLIHQSQTTMASFLSFSPQNFEVTMPVRCGTQDTWAMLVGNYIVGPSGYARLVKLVYDSVGKTWTVTTGINIQTPANCNLVSADIIYDNTDSSIMVFFPQGISADTEWYRHDFASLAQSNGTVAVRLSLTNRQYSSVNVFSVAMLLSDGNYSITGTTAGFQGGVFSWNGSVFSATGTNNLGSVSAYKIKIAEDTFVSEVTISEGTSIVDIAQYTSGTTTLDFQAQMTKQRLAIPAISAASSSNASNHFEYIGNNTLIVISSDSRGYITWDTTFNILPERTKLVSTPNITEQVNRNFVVDEKYICYTSGVIRHGNTESFSPVLSSFCGSQIVDGYRPIEGGSLVAENAGNIDIAVTAETIDSPVTLVSGDTYGDYVAIDTITLLKRDLKEHSFYMVSNKTYNDSLVQGVAFSATQGLNNLNINTSAGNSSRNILGSGSGHFWGISSASVAEAIAILFTDSGVPLGSYTQNLQNSSTSRNHFKTTGIRKLGLAIYCATNSTELDGIMEVI